MHINQSKQTLLLNNLQWGVFVQTGSGGYKHFCYN